MDNITKGVAEELKLDMIEEGIWKEIAKEIGTYNLCIVLDYVGGLSIYIPKLDRMLRPARDSKIKKEFTGYNFNSLAKKYSLTERAIRDIIADGEIHG